MSFKYVNDDFLHSNIHYAGWKTVTEYLKTVTYKGDMIVDMYVDATFHFRQEHFEQRLQIPYNTPWIGFIHHTTTGPNNSRDLFANPFFLTSLLHCKALIVLSNNLQEQLAPLVDAVAPPQGPVRLHVLRHPVKASPVQFSMERLRANQNKLLLHVGNWMRDVDRFVQLPVRGNRFSKVILKGPLNSFADVRDVTTLPNQTNAQYDELLSRNVVCIYLKDASANNTILECVARNTPIIVNRLPAVVEYLGAGYPLYADNCQADINAQLTDAMLLRAHEYLKALNKSQLTFQHFTEQFQSTVTTLGVAVADVACCAICLDEMYCHNDLIYFSCFHQFGTECVRKCFNHLVTSNIRCPVCRTGTLLTDESVRIGQNVIGAAAAPSNRRGWGGHGAMYS